MQTISIQKVLPTFSKKKKKNYFHFGLHIRKFSYFGYTYTYMLFVYGKCVVFLLVWFASTFFPSLQNADSYKSNSGAKSEARMPAVYRAHHNARILCVMEHPTLKMRQNASLLLDVQCEYIMFILYPVRHSFFLFVAIILLIYLQVLHFFMIVCRFFGYMTLICVQHTTVCFLGLVTL